jgi:hypothetical protein
MPKPEPSPQLNALLTIAAGFIGLGGYLYVFGGIELFLSFDDAGLPAGDAIDVFAARRFLTVGLFVVGIVLVFTLASLAVVVFMMAVRPRWKPDAEQRTATMFRFAVGLFALWTVVITVGAPLVKPFHLRVARVLTVQNTCVQGAYLGTDSVGTHLVDGKRKRLLLIPTADVKSVALGSAPEVINTPIVELGQHECLYGARNW